MLKGGYVLFLIFRGDNTTPVIKKEFSPLHNRCLLALSKLLVDGSEGYCDNLYSSVDYFREVSCGGTYTAEIPAGPRAGETETIVVPKTGLCGTARTNRGIPSACRQPDKTGMSKKKQEELKAKPLEERVKSQMTTTNPRVICASVFDNGPVHMLDTIHTSAGIITKLKPRWDPASHKKIKLPLSILALIDEYNNNMHYVDIRDHLAKEYHLDGGFWHDLKWWMPIFKEIFKSSCDQGYVMYKRVCEIEEKARAERVRAEREAAGKAAAEKAREAKKTEAQAVADAAAAAAAIRSKQIKPMAHLEFLEKIAEGFVIEAYNSTKDAASNMMSLNSYDLTRIERALAEMRGEQPPSKGAMGMAAPSTVVGVKRKIAAVVQADGRLAAHELDGDEKHALIDACDAVQLGLITDGHRKNSLFCAYKFCYWAAQNKKQRCGENCSREQEGRAKCQLFCKHPRCMRGYHASCWSISHGLCEPF